MMKVSFELSNKDLRFFRERLKQVRRGHGTRDESAVIHGAATLAKEAVEVGAPDFVLQRIGILEKLIGMVTDLEWRLEGADRRRILDALAYFVDPDDLIPDKIPGLGFIDDAIMIELVARELVHEIAAYDDFCAFRKIRPKSEASAKLEARRKALHARMRRRRRREREIGRHSRGRSISSRIRLW